MANISPQKILPEPPYKTPIADQSGFISQAWVGFFRQLFHRAGGSVAYSNAELETLQNQNQTSVSTQITALDNNNLNIGRQL